MSVNNPADILELKDEQLCELYMQTCDTEDEIHAQKVAIRQELQARLEDRKKDGDMAGNYSFTKYTVTTFKTSIEDAEQFGAVKIEKKIDTTILRKLLKNGVEVPGTTSRTDVKITEIKKEA